MKTAIYIDDGVKQIVLTPESKFEKKLLEDINDDDFKKTVIREGEFYACQGGFTRHSDHTESKSIIINFEG